MAFRDGSYQCPVCNSKLEVGKPMARCPECAGAWVGEGDLEERIRAVRGKSELEILVLFAPTALERSRRRPCPNCREVMEAKQVGSVEVERCANRHGIWFDAAELQELLHASSRGVGVLTPTPDHRGTELDVRGTNSSDHSRAGLGAGDGFDVLADVISNIVGD